MPKCLFCFCLSGLPRIVREELLKEWVADDRLMVMKLRLTACCHQLLFFWRGGYRCVCSSHVLFLPPWASWPRCAFTWDRRVQWRQNCGLLATVLLNWQRKGEWHAENYKRSVRCERAQKEGGKACPGHFCWQCSAHTICLILNTLCLTWDFDTQNTVFKLLVSVC